MKNLLSLLVALLSGFSAIAVNPQIASCETLPAGSLVLLETAEKFSSDQVTIGKMLKFKVTTNVVVNGKVLITTGAIATGRVKSIAETTYNNPEEITITLLSVQAVDGQQVWLNGHEQTFAGQFPNQAVTVETGQSIVATVMNNTLIKP